MLTSAGYFEAPRRLRAFVRAHETSLIILTALVASMQATARNSRPQGAKQ